MNCGLLADIVAVLHGLVVVFIAATAILIPIGLWRRWQWVRGFWLRTVHLAVCLCVIAFEWLNMACPLTTLEQALRDRAGQEGFEGSFIAHYVSETITLEVAPVVLAVPTSVLVIVVAVLYAVAGPFNRDRDSRPARGSGSHLLQPDKATSNADGRNTD
jgi:hypothetical protein